MSMRFIKVLIVSILLLAPGISSAGTGDMNAALGFIDVMGADKALSGQLYNMAKKTTPVQGMIKANGEEKVDAELQAQINASMEKYGPELKNNLAEIYLSYFSPDELQVIAEKKPESSIYARYISSQAEIDQKMLAKSKPIIEKVLSESITVTFSKFGQ